MIEVISIPIIILRRAQIKTQQKIAFGFFLCISIIMVLVAFIRLSKTSGIGGYDLRWEWYWELMEAYIAILAASITAFRSVFTNQNVRDRNLNRWKPSASWIERAKHWKRNQKSEEDEEDQLPSIPRALLTGMSTHIQRCGRTEFEQYSLDKENEVQLNELHNKHVHVQHEWQIEPSANS